MAKLFIIIFYNGLLPLYAMQHRIMYILPKKIIDILFFVTILINNNTASIILIIFIKILLQCSTKFAIHILLLYNYLIFDKMSGGNGTRTRKITEPKSVALPFGDTPVFETILISIFT